MEMNENEWRQLVTKAIGGDMAAFERLYSMTYRAVYFTCLKLLANEQNAKDVMQDSYMTALEKLGTLEDGAKFPQWLNAIAINKCRTLFVKRSEDSLEEHIENGDGFNDCSFIPEEYVTDNERRRVIMQIVDTQLSDVQRRTVLLYYYNGLSIAEIAAVMDCPEGTVKYRLSAAREKLREAVLIYEKEHGDRLHAIAPVPVLTRILRAEAQNTAVPDIRPVLGRKAAEATAKNLAKKAGGNSMKNVLLGKIAAGIAAVAVVGGITAVVLHSRNDDEGLVDNTSSAAVVEAESEAETTSTESSSPVEESSRPETTTAEVTIAPEESLAEPINDEEYEKAKEYYEELKNAQVECIAATVDDLRPMAYVENDYGISLDDYDKETQLVLAYKGFMTQRYSTTYNRRLVDKEGNYVPMNDAQSLNTVYDENNDSIYREPVLYVQEIRVVGAYEAEDLAMRFEVKGYENELYVDVPLTEVGFADYENLSYENDMSKIGKNIKSSHIIKYNGRHYLAVVRNSGGGGSQNAKTFDDYNGNGRARVGSYWIWFYPLEGGYQGKDIVDAIDQPVVEGDGKWTARVTHKSDNYDTDIFISIVFDIAYYLDGDEAIPEKEEFVRDDYYLEFPDGEGGISRLNLLSYN